MALQLPFEPMRKGLYTAAELLAGYDPEEPATLAQALDYRIYRYWVIKGRFKPNYHHGMPQCLHDNAVTHAVANLVKDHKVVAVMGGHALRRDDDTFGQVATLARQLSRAGFLIVSGGGPGAMEAAHFGALHAFATDTDFASASYKLATTPAFPVHAGNLVSREGALNQPALEEIAIWLSAALDLRCGIDKPGRSLGIPTWRYGHEPTSVFATDIAKYFENSVREDGLLSVATHGVVFAPGSAGTLQEVFQNAVFNTYADEDRKPSPMIFLGTSHWHDSAVLSVLKKLFGEEAYDTYVTLTDDVDHVLDVLRRFGTGASPSPPFSSEISGPALSLPKMRFDDSKTDGAFKWPV